MRLWFFTLAIFLAIVSGTAAKFPYGEGNRTPNPHSFDISCPSTATTSGTLSCSGTYLGTAPSTGGWSFLWHSTCSGSGTPTVSGVSGSVITTISIPTPSSACAGTLTVVDNLGDAAPLTGTITVSSASNSIALSCPGTGATSSTISCTGIYVGTAPSTSGWTFSWNSTCSATGSATISGIGGGAISSISVATDGSPCTGTLSVLDDLGDPATSSSVAISTPGPLSLLAVEDGSAFGSGAYPFGYSIGGVGKYSGAAPSSMTATMSGCGGGTPAVTGLVTGVYGSGTYQIQIAMPTTAGTGCTVTVTDNLSRTATSPAFKVISTTQGSTITANIHNAPGWQASHTYSTTGMRVLNGAGWTPGSPGHFNPGSPLYAYELTSGSCTSASSGGPVVTTGSTTDGSCTWVEKSIVDYVTLTGFGIDAPLWVSGKTYTYFEGMTINDGGTLRAYQLDGGNRNAFCTSTVAPTGTGSSGSLWGTGQQTTGDTCVWNYLGDVTYSSQVSHIPFASYVNHAADVLVGDIPAATAHHDREHVALLWSDAEYVAGSGGERNPIALFGHSSNPWNVEGHIHGPVYTSFIAAAPGEGFKDHITTSVPLTGYDATKGVALRNPNSTGDSVASVSGDTFNAAGAAGLFLYDLFTDVRGIQIKATNGPGVTGFNDTTIMNNIIDGGYNGTPSSWCMGIWVDNISIIINNLVLTHGCAAIGAKYGNVFIMWNTLVNVGPQSNTSALIFSWAWVFQPVVMANNAISGYAHITAQNTATAILQGVQQINSLSTHNVTDIASPDNTGTSWWVDGSAGTTSVRATPGVTFGVSAASMFVSPGSDYRPNTGLSTAGAAYGAFYINCWTGYTDCVPNMLNFDSPDFLGNTRPNGSSQYSTGAEQHP